MKFLGYNDKYLKDRRRLLRKNQTDAESKLWSRLRRKQFQSEKFFRQYSVGPYILDFYCPKRRIAIELDGGQHMEPTQKQDDAERTRFLRSQGIQVIRFWNNDVLKNTEGVLAIIGEAFSNPSQPPLILRGGI